MGNLTGVLWRKATRCGGNTGDQSSDDNSESCVLVAVMDVDARD